MSTGGSSPSTSPPAGRPRGWDCHAHLFGPYDRFPLAAAIDADSLPLQKQLAAQEGLYTVLPLHAVWSEVQDGTLQAARIVSPPLQRRVAMAQSKSKGPTRAVSAVAAQIVAIVDEHARRGMWRVGDAADPDATAANAAAQ